MQRLNNKLSLNSVERVHFLGCGGLKLASKIKQATRNGSNFSVDNSTPWNRSIDGNTSGTAQSGYFDYTTKEMVRINPDTVSQIIQSHSNANNPLFSVAEMRRIIAKILEHQSHQSNHSTYEARASLAIHNHDVFRRNAE